MTEDEKQRQIAWFLIEKGATQLPYQGEPKDHKEWRRRQEKKQAGNRSMSLKRSGKGA